MAKAATTEATEPAEHVFAEFRVLAHTVEDGAVKVFAHLTSAAGSTLTGVAGEIVRLADDLGDRLAYVLHPLLEPVNAEAHALVARARALDADESPLEAPQSAAEDAAAPQSPETGDAATDGGGDTAPSNPPEEA